MGFELATSMTVDKRSIHYATNSPCDWFVHVIKCILYVAKGICLLDKKAILVYTGKFSCK